MCSLHGRVVLCASLLFASVWPAAAEATHLAPRSDELAREARHRLALAEEQRALVEELSEAACIVAHDIDTVNNLALIEKVRAQFEAVLGGLAKGDAALGIKHEEHNSRVLRALDQVQKEWKPFVAAVDVVIDTGGVPEPQRETLFEGDRPLLDALGLLVARLESAYADPATATLADVVLVDLIARQEMITQAIGKDVCLIALGWKTDVHAESLKQQLDTLQAAHTALSSGMPAMSIAPPPTAEIATALDAFHEKWAPQQAVAERSLAGEPLDPEVLRSFFATNLLLLDDIRAIVALYEAL